jgi:hypothetical protein
MSTLITIPAHDFEPSRRAVRLWPADEPRCGYYHRLATGMAALLDSRGVLCVELAGHPVHNGTDAQLRVRANDETEEN